MQNDIQLAPKCEFKRNGLLISPDMKFEDWMSLGGKLKTMNGAIHFWIGDWLCFGERKYGETYSQAMSETEYSYKTLSNDKWVASRIAFSRRREGLSFDHHASVAEFEPEDQELLLNQAEEHKITSAKFRKLVYQYRINLDLGPEMTAEQIQSAQVPHADFDTVQPVIDFGTSMLETLDKIQFDILEVNARDYLLSHLRDIVAKAGNIIVQYGKQNTLHSEVGEKPQLEA